jgi:hypothetical protein
MCCRKLHCTNLAIATIFTGIRTFFALHFIIPTIKEAVKRENEDEKFLIPKFHP